MPLYDYRCNNCGRTTTVFTRSISQRVEPRCPHCGGTDMARLVSRFAYHKTIQQVHEESGPPSPFPSLDYYKDPRNIGRFVEETFQKHGVELPESIKESIRAAREGELPKELDL